MYFCYVDESGALEPPDETRNSTPVMVVLGIIIDADHIPQITRDFLDIKRYYLPQLFRGPRSLNDILTEVKGSSLLKMTRGASFRHRHQAAGMRTAVLNMLERYGCRIIGRVWIKELGVRMNPNAYSYSMQDLALHFGHFLLAHDSRGVLIGDSRSPAENASVAHSLFTQKWRAAGDPYQRLMEVSLFAHSQNHAGIQLADLVASTLVFSMAAAAYGAPPVSVHSSPRYHDVRDAHGDALDRLQYRYEDAAGRRRGGLVVSDRARGRSGALLFNTSKRLVVPGQRQGGGLLTPISS